MQFINLTTHAINLNDGRVFDPSGTVCRIETAHTDIINDVCEVVFSGVHGLPEPQEGVCYIVSLPVLQGLRDKRKDLVAPATNHPKTIRNEKGHIVSVPCFIK
jgi:hypothetical protein